MQMKESEILRYMHRHHKNVRAGMCGGKPSEVALRSWKLYDAHQELMIALAERREAAEAAAQQDEFILTTEVKIK